MREYRTMRLMVLYYMYLLVLTVITSYIQWFDADGRSVLLLAILLALPYLAGKYLYRDRALQKKIEKRKAAVCQVEFLVAFGVLSPWGGLLSANTPSQVLCSLFFAGALGIFLYSKYYYGKYLILRCNPSVSESTMKRAEAGGRKNLARVVVVSLLAALAVMAALALLPKPQVRPPEWRIQEKKEDAVKKVPEHRQDEVPEKIRELEEMRGEGILAMILRYLLLLVAALGIVFILGMLVYRLISYLALRRHSEYADYEEKWIEAKDNDEYVELVPVPRKPLHFPEGNDGRVRKLFYQRVRKGARGRKVEQFRTPVELGEAYLKPDESDGLLVALYEKARYSPETVSDQEIRQWEQASGKK